MYNTRRRASIGFGLLVVAVVLFVVYHDNSVWFSRNNKQNLPFGGNFTSSYINLDDDIDKKSNIESQASSSAILSGRLVRFPGVDGTELNLHDFLREKKITVPAYDSIAWRNWYVYGENLTAGALGCLESHVSLWKSVVQTGTPALILEDDVILRPDFDNLLYAATRELPDNFDLFYLASFNRPLAIANQGLVSYSTHLDRMTGPYHHGTYGYIVSAKAAQLLLDSVYPAYKQIDSIIIDVAQRNNMSVFVSKHDILTTNSDANRDSVVQRHQIDVFEIPKTFHFIWPSSEPLPRHLHLNIKRWSTLHPEFETKIWDQKKVEQHFPNMHGLLNADDNEKHVHGLKVNEWVNSLSYSILAQEGGLVVDLHLVPRMKMSGLFVGMTAFAVYSETTEDLTVVELDSEEIFLSCDVKLSPLIFGSTANHSLIQFAMTLQPWARPLRKEAEKKCMATENQWEVTLSAAGVSEEAVTLFEPHIFFPTEEQQHTNEYNVHLSATVLLTDDQLNSCVSQEKQNQDELFNDCISRLVPDQEAIFDTFDDESEEDQEDQEEEQHLEARQVNPGLVNCRPVDPNGGGGALPSGVLTPCATPSPHTCGNGIVESGEACDYGSQPVSFWLSRCCNIQSCRYRLVKQVCGPPQLPNTRCFGPRYCGVNGRCRPSNLIPQAKRLPRCRRFVRRPPVAP